MTNSRNPLFSSILLSGLLAAPALAQDPDATTPGSPQLPPVQNTDPATSDMTLPATTRRAGAGLASLRTPIHTAAADLGHSYGIWGAGDDYKVSFHDGMTFVPYLGKDYPRTQSLSWTTTSVKAGATELVENGAIPSHVQGDYRYEYRYPAFTEAYDVLAEGLEQTFVFHQLPAAGDLVITGAVSSPMTTRNVESRHQNLVFVDDGGRSVVDYGRAFAFDASGSTVCLETACEDGDITLRVPGSWLASAEFPVTVDPLLSRVQIATWGASTFGTIDSIDIARDDEAVTKNVMVTYTRYASAGDSDLWARLCDDDFSSNVQVFGDITTSWDTDDVSCAFVGGADRFVIAFRRYFFSSTPTQSRIRAHVHDSGATTYSTAYSTLFTSSSENEWRVDCGGVESYRTGNKALIVFQSEDNGTGNFAGTAKSAVKGSLFDATTTNGSFGTAFSIYDYTTQDAERPSVNQVAEGGSSFSWVCAMQVYNNTLTGDDWDIIGKRIGHDGTVATGSFVSDLALATPGYHQLQPVVEGSNGRYAVLFSTVDLNYTSFKTASPLGRELRIERFDWDDGISGPSAAGNKAPVLLRSSTRRYWESTGLGYDTDTDSHWAPAFRYLTGTSGVACYARVGFNGAPTEGPSGTTLYYVSGETPTGIACVYDNDNDDFLFAYGVDDGTTSLPVFGHALRYVTPTPASTSGIACSAATISWLGSQQIGSEYGRIHVVNGTVPVGHFLVASLATTNAPMVHPVVFPGCQLLVQATGPAYLGTLPFQYGSTVSWPLALPEFLSPMTLHFQDWIYDGTLFYGTQRLSVPLVK